MLLGEAWKSLPMDERTSYSTKAKVMADEQKKINPDCWKRKKTVATSTTVTGCNTPLGENPTTPTLMGVSSGVNPTMGGTPGPKTIATTAPMFAGTNSTPAGVALASLTRPLPLPPGLPRHPPPLEVAAQRMDRSSPLDIV